MATRSKARAGKMDVWDEFGNAEAPGQHRKSGPATAPEHQGCLVAQQWLTALGQWCEGAQGLAVKQQLSELLRCGSRSKDKLAGVANRARQQIANVFSWSHQVEDYPGPDTPQRARQCQYLFERALHGVLLAALAAEEAASAAQADVPAGSGSPGGGLGLSSVARSRVVEAVLEDAEYQLGLVHACIEVVNFAYLRTPSEAFPWATLQLQRLHHTLELWQGIEWIADHLLEPPAGAEGVVPGIPEEVLEYLSAVQVRVEEELAFMDGSSIYRRIVCSSGAHQGGGGTGDGPFDSEAAESEGDSPQRQARGGSRGGTHVLRSGGPDAALVARFLSNLATTAMLRTQVTAQEVLEEHSGLKDICPDLPKRGCAVVDAVLSDRLELLFGQHLSVVIACSLFYTIRVHGGSLSFRKLTGLMASLLPNHDEDTFGRVELPPEDGSGWDGSRDYGDTRALYNKVFLQVFGEYDASSLFGDELLAPTPSKEQLIAHSTPVVSHAPDGGHLLPGGSSQTRMGAEAAAGGAAKHQKQQRRPLGQVTNSNGGGPSGSILRTR